MLCAASYRFCESPAQATGSELALPSVCSAFVLSCLTFVTCVFLVYFLGFAAHSRPPPTPRVGGRVLPLDCPRLVHSHLRFQASLNSSSPSGKCPPAPRRLPLRVPSSPASSLLSEKTPLTFYAALPPPAGARAGNQVPSLPETASGLCVMSKILGAGRAAPPGPGAGEGRQGDASARCR